MDFCTNCVNEYAWRPTDTPFPKECKECEVVNGKPSNFKPKNKTNADRMIQMIKENDTSGLLDWWQEICEDGVPGEDYFAWWLKLPAKEEE